MKKLMSVLLLLCPLLHGLTLVEEGAVRAAIVLEEEPTKAAQLAAYELQAHIFLITGAQLPILHEEPQELLPIRIGHGIDTEVFEDQEYLVRVTPNELLLAGRDAPDHEKVSYRVKHGAHEIYDITTWPGFWDRKATLWAVYDFLERGCGIRWLSPVEVGTDFEPRRTLIVEEMEVRRQPSFPTRNVFTLVHSQWYDSFTSLWHPASDGFAAYEAAAYPRMREQFTHEHTYQNWAKRGTHRAFLYRKRVGGDFFSANHSLYNFYDRFWKQNPRNPDIFVEERPDWFAKTLDNLGRPQQPCYTNPAVQQQIVDDALAWFGGTPLNPNSGQPLADRNQFWGTERYAVVPMDNGGYCECADCQARLRPLEEPYTFANGIASDLVWPVINRTAEAVGEAYPGKRVAALAYSQYAAYPRDLTLASNIDVQYCMHIRAPYARESWEHEHRLFAEWAAQDHPLYMWLYYCFPTEMANRGEKPSWHVFPGFFAHTIASEFKYFHQSGVRGFFMNGFGQDVEAYVTFALLDDVTLDIDHLLDEYFTRGYGPAGKPLRQLYERIEQIYCDPTSYPPNFNGHQHQIIAWAWLGTGPRMAELRTIMDQARVAILDASPIQQDRFQLFDLAVWQYLEQGKAQYEEQMKGWYSVPHLSSPFVFEPVPDHDPRRVDWHDATPMMRWTGLACEASQRQIIGRITHDDEFLYVRLTEKGAAPTKDDYWQVLTAAKTDGEVREFRLDATSTGSTVTEDGWELYAAIPLAELTADGLRPGGALLLNAARRSPGDPDQPIWVPTFAGYDHAPRYARISLDPAPPPTSNADGPGLVARWRFEDDGESVLDSSGNNHHGTIHGPITRCDSPFGRGILFPVDQRAAWIEVQGIETFAGAEVTPDDAMADIETAVGLDDAPPQAGPPFTFEAWIQTAAATTQPEQPSYPRLFSAPGDTFDVHLRPGNLLWLSANPQEGKQEYLYAQRRAFTPGEWQHVVGVFDGQRLLAYVNGRHAGTSREPIRVPLRRMAGALRLGLPHTNVRHLQFRGMMDEVSLYDRALTATEIAARFRAGLQAMADK